MPRAKQEPTVWRSIDTAPRDGTKVVLYHPDWLECPIARWDVVEGSDERGEGGFCLWIVDDENGGSQGDGLLWPDDDGEPTLWAPLPTDGDNRCTESDPCP
jgi:hypothetical protein